MKNILITGGAGFIGSHLVKWMLEKYDYNIINFDLLTYAGNLQNLTEIENNSNYTFVRGDIRDEGLLNDVFKRFEITDVIHLAAESHVDRSIENPLEFINTNVLGTVALLNVCRKFWSENYHNHLFYHVSTDEVYGSLDEGGFFKESTAYDPRSPYSASKASSDHFVRAYYHTYGIPIKISNCSNNYGSFQFPEKLIPLMINNIKNNKPLPIYGKGDNIRDWLWVVDHCSAIDVIFHNAAIGETYNIGGINEWKNIDLVNKLCEIMDSKLGRETGESAKLITYVTDRAGHDMRYAIDPNKVENDLKWNPSITFEEGLEKTVEWYLDNEEWMQNVTTGNYLAYYEKMYKDR